MYQGRILYKAIYIQWKGTLSSKAAEELCVAIQKVYQPLKGKESLIKTSTFTKTMNHVNTFGGDLLDLTNYTAGNVHK